MNELSKILEDINLPKQIIDKAEKLFGILFGKGLEEYGLTIQDKVRYRRYKNQLKIFSQAQELLEKSGLNPKEISLKMLVPLIEFCSLEEEPFLQEKWSRLIASSSTNKDDDNLTQSYIEILKRLSVNEAKTLDFLYDSFSIRKLDEENAYKKSYPNAPDFTLNHRSIKFDKIDVFESFDFDEDRFNYYLENLFVHGLIIWDLPEVDTAMKGFMRHIALANSGFGNLHNYNYYPLMRDEAKLRPPSAFAFTYLGIGFVKACKFIK